MGRYPLVPGHSPSLPITPWGDPASAGSVGEMRGARPVPDASGRPIHEQPRELLHALPHELDALLRVDQSGLPLGPGSALIRGGCSEQADDAGFT